MRNCSMASEKILVVFLWRLDTAMRAASLEKSGCCVAQYAAVCGCVWMCVCVCVCVWV